MGRKSRLERQHSRRGYIPAKEFREILEWLDAGIVEIVTEAGGEGIDEELIPRALSDREPYPPIGWHRLGAKKRSSQFGAAVRRLTKACRVEEYHSWVFGESPATRLRPVNLLDRLAHALRESE